jgi:hypothetical protein
MNDHGSSQMEDRGEIMRRDAYILGIVGMAIVNGMHFSFYYLPAFLLMRPFVQITFFTGSPMVTSYLTSLMLSTFTIMLAGIPAAIYERLRGLKRSSAVSFAIWLGGAVLITLPTIMTMASSGAGP